MGRRTAFEAWIFLAGVLFAPNALARPPEISVSWVDIKSQDECVKQASAGLRDNFFIKNFHVIGNRTVSGERRELVAVVRCFGEKGVAFIAVTGEIGTRLPAMSLQSWINPHQSESGPVPDPDTIPDK
jgi:hypothetical protein